MAKMIINIIKLSIKFDRYAISFSYAKSRKIGAADAKGVPDLQSASNPTKTNGGDQSKVLGQLRTNQETLRGFLMHSVASSAPAGTPAPPGGPLGTPGPNTGEWGSKSCVLGPIFGLPNSRVAEGELLITNTS